MSVNYKKLWKLMIDKNLSKTELTHLAGISTNAMATALRQLLIMQFIMRCKMLRVNMVASSTRVAIVELKSEMCSWIMRLEQF